jgi:GTPase involved in cell partitioning and DNA repair
MGCEASRMREELTNVSNCIEKINAELSTVKELLIEKNETIVHSIKDDQEEVKSVEEVKTFENEEVVEKFVDILHSIQNKLERIETKKYSPPGFLW